jgi:intergrase/recombinase
VRKPRFKKVLDYFRKLEDRLKLFEIYSEAFIESNLPIETKKEAAFNRPISSSSGKIRSRDKDITASRQHANFARQKSIISQLIEIGRFKLVFDFGLILEQSLAHYSGLQFSVIVKDLR